MISQKCVWRHPHESPELARKVAAAITGLISHVLYADLPIEILRNPGFQCPTKCGVMPLGRILDEAFR